MARIGYIGNTDHNGELLFQLVQFGPGFFDRAVFAKHYRDHKTVIVVTVMSSLALNV